MWSGRLAKARRGELAVPLPSGYVRRPSGEVVLDPDEQVQAVIRLIFDLFERLGTVNAVLCFLADNHIQLGVRVREGPARGELEWRRPSRATLQNILRNPAYAGIYVYGRSTTDPRRRQAGRPFTGRVRTAREDWAVFLPGLLPGYITIGQYEKNRQRMEANRSWSQGMGVARNGPALLAGLVACGRCGQKMTVRYHRGPGGKLRPVYVCAREKADHGAGQCQQLAGPCVDAYVTGLMLDAMAPAPLEGSLAADIPTIWHAPTTTDADRKQLIRHLIERVQVTVAGTSEKAEVHVVWAGGHRTTAQITRPVASLTQLSYYPQLAERARELAHAGLTHAQIAAQLTTEGFRPP